MTLSPDDVVLPESHDVRRADPSDLAAVHRVETRGQQAPWSMAVLQKEFSVDWSNVWLVESESEVVAYLCFWIVADEVHILNVVVDPSARRRGIAGALVRGLIAETTGKPLTLITLEVRVGNEAARRLYESVGFHEIGRRAGYYSDNGEDAIVMALILEEDDTVG